MSVVAEIYTSMFPFLLVLGAYLLGSLPFGLTIGKVFFHKDVRDFGSGNVGATNVYRTFGPVAGIAAFVLDLGKGLLPVLAARHWFPGNAWLIVGCGLAAILGHNFSPFLKFKGGKGVATSLGVTFGLSWQAALAGFAVWGVVMGVTGYVSLGSMFGAVVVTALLWTLNHPAGEYRRILPYGLFGMLACIFVFFTHRANIKRLMSGTEPKIHGKDKHPVPSDAPETPKEKVDV